MARGFEGQRFLTSTVASGASGSCSVSSRKQQKRRELKLHLRFWFEQLGRSVAVHRGVRGVSWLLGEFCFDTLKKLSEEREVRETEEKNAILSPTHPPLNFFLTSFVEHDFQTSTHRTTLLLSLCRLPKVPVDLGRWLFRYCIKKGKHQEGEGNRRILQPQPQSTGMTGSLVLCRPSIC